MFNLLRRPLQNIDRLQASLASPTWRQDVGEDFTWEHIAGTVGVIAFGEEAGVVPFLGHHEGQGGAVIFSCTPAQLAAGSNDLHTEDVTLTHQTMSQAVFKGHH